MKASFWPPGSAPIMAPPSMAIWTSPFNRPAIAGGAVVLTIWTGAPDLSSAPDSMATHNGAKLGLAPTQAMVIVPGLVGGMDAAADALAAAEPLAAGLADAAALAGALAAVDGLAAALAGAELGAGAAELAGAAAPPQAVRMRQMPVRKAMTERLFI